MDSKNSSKLTGKDLVTIGIYAAIYFLVTMVISFIGFAPLAFVLLDVIIPLITAIPFMLYLTKVKKFGMITIFSVICGILMAVTGMGYVVILTCLVFGLLADLIMKGSDYKGKAVPATSVFMGWIWGVFLPLYFNREATIAAYAERGMEEFARGRVELLPMWTLPLTLVCAVIAGFIGAKIGKALLKKHFERAGIA